jgi:hypothetical protein
MPEGHLAVKVQLARTACKQPFFAVTFADDSGFVLLLYACR